MRPQDIVAILLTVGVLVMLISGTYVRCIWMDCTDVDIGRPESIAFWKDVMNILIGGLIGYMVGNKNDTKT